MARRSRGPAPGVDGRGRRRSRPRRRSSLHYAVATCKSSLPPVTSRLRPTCSSYSIGCVPVSRRWLVSSTPPVRSTTVSWLRKIGSALPPRWRPKYAVAGTFTCSPAGWISWCCSRRAPQWPARQVRPITRPRMRSRTRWRGIARSVANQQSASTGARGRISARPPTASSRARVSCTRSHPTTVCALWRLRCGATRRPACFIALSWRCSRAPGRISRPKRSAPLLRELVPRAPAVASSSTVAHAPSARHEPTLRERLAATAPNRRRTLLRDHVRQLTAKVLGLGRPDGLNDDEPLRQLGLDSLMAVELRNLLGSAIAQTLPATITFDHPSVSALVGLSGGRSLRGGIGRLRCCQPLPRRPIVASPHVPGVNEDSTADELASRLDRDT